MFHTRTKIDHVRVAVLSIAGYANNLVRIGDRAETRSILYFQSRSFALEACDLFLHRRPMGDQKIVGRQWPPLRWYDLGRLGNVKNFITFNYSKAIIIKSTDSHVIVSYSIRSSGRCGKALCSCG